MLSISETSSLKSTAASGPPPSYSRHQHDELLLASAVRTVATATTSNSTSLLPLRLQPPPRSSGVVEEEQFFDAAQMLMLLTSNDPLHLTIDNNLVYPPPPSSTLYHLPRVLTWSGNEIFLSRSVPLSGHRRSSAALTRDFALYTMRRTPFTNDISLMPRREGLKSAMMKGKRSLLSGMSWEIEVKGDVILKYAKGKWKDADGNLVASEKLSNSDTKADPNSPVREEILIEGNGIELWMKDLVVAAWCTRIWANYARVSLARMLIRGQGL